MDGYRQDNFDLDGQDAETKTAKGYRWKAILAGVVWVGPLIWLTNQDGYPESFGVHYRSTSGRGQTAEDFYYSYLLLERHHLLDVITFAWIWAPIIGLVGWIAYPRLRNLRTANFSLYSDSSKGA